MSSLTYTIYAQNTYKYTVALGRSMSRSPRMWPMARLRFYSLVRNGTWPRHRFYSMNRKVNIIRNYSTIKCRWIFLLVRLHTVLTRIGRSDQRSAVHAIITGDGQNAVRCQNWLGTTNLFASWRFATPRSTLLAFALIVAVQFVRICARIRGLWSNERAVLHISEGSVCHRLQWATVDVFTEWRVTAPFAILHAFQLCLTAQHMASVAMVLNRWVNVIIVANNVRAGRHIRCFACDHWNKNRNI